MNRISLQQKVTDLHTYIQKDCELSADQWVLVHESTFVNLAVFSFVLSHLIPPQYGKFTRLTFLNKFNRFTAKMFIFMSVKFTPNYRGTTL